MKTNRRFFLVSVCPSCGLDLTNGLLIKGDAEDYSVKMSEEGEIVAPSGYAECLCGCWLDDYLSPKPARPRKLTYRKAVDVVEYPTGDIGSLAKGLINYAVSNHFLSLLQGSPDAVEKEIDDSLEKIKECVKSWKKRFEDRFNQPSKPDVKKK